MLPEISVIIPVFNGEREVGLCVESVLKSRLPAEKREVICIDNNSTDGTLSVLRSFGPAIQVLQESKRGAAAARNAGLRWASGAYIAFTDADCTVHPDWVANIVEPLRHGKACAVGGRILARPGAGPIERFGELIHNHRRAIEVERPPYIIGMNMASRRDLLLSLGGFDERWIRAQDGDLSFRLLAAGRKLGYVHDAVIFHHNRDTIAALMREGFIHGYYGAAFSRTYRDFVREYRLKMEPEPPPPPQDPPNPRLSAWQIRLLWKVFKEAKRVGRLIGRRFPPVVVD